jgi:hypothetical protein
MDGAWPARYPIWNGCSFLQEEVTGPDGHYFLLVRISHYSGYLVLLHYWTTVLLKAESCDQ